MTRCASWGSANGSGTGSGTGKAEDLANEAGLPAVRGAAARDQAQEAVRVTLRRFLATTATARG